MVGEKSTRGEESRAKDNSFIRMDSLFKYIMGELMTKGL